jgi:hypothetical protein
MKRAEFPKRSECVRTVSGRLWLLEGVMKRKQRHLSTAYHSYRWFLSCGQWTCQLPHSNRLEVINNFRLSYKGRRV